MDPNANAAADATQTQAQAHYTVTIGVDAQGDPTVDQETLDVGRRGSPVVRWVADPTVGGRAWMVAFGGPTPFRNGRAVFSNLGPGNSPQQGPIDRQTPLGDQYKYWVFVADTGGDWRSLDPRLRITDELGTRADTAGGGGD